MKISLDTNRYNNVLSSSHLTSLNWENNPHGDTKRRDQGTRTGNVGEDYTGDPLNLVKILQPFPGLMRRSVSSGRVYSGAR